MPSPVPAVDEERVVGLRRRLGDRERRRVREAVRRADHEQVEGVLRVQPGQRLARLGLLAGRRPRAARATRRRGSARDISPSLASLTAARTRLPKWVSIHSRVKLFGTATTSSPFEIADGPGLAEPGAVGRVVQRALEPTGHLGPERISSHSESLLHPSVPASFASRKWARAYQRAPGATTGPRRALFHGGLTGFAGLFRRVHTVLHRCGKRWIFGAGNTAPAASRAEFASSGCGTAGCGQPPGRIGVGYTRETGARSASFYDETDLSAERAATEAQARLPCPHGDACRPGDPQAPPGEGPQAALGLTVRG